MLIVVCELLLTVSCVLTSVAHSIDFFLYCFIHCETLERPVDTNCCLRESLVIKESWNYFVCFCVLFCFFKIRCWMFVSLCKQWIILFHVNVYLHRFIVFSFLSVPPPLQPTYNSASLFRFLHHKIILPTQLAPSAAAMPRCLGGAVGVGLTRWWDDLITGYSQTKLYFQVLWLRLFNPPVPSLLSSWLRRRCSSGQFLLSAVISGFSSVSSQQLFFQAASPVEGRCICLPSLFSSRLFHSSPRLSPSHLMSPPPLKLGGVSSSSCFCYFAMQSGVLLWQRFF